MLESGSLGHSVLQTPALVLGALRVKRDVLWVTVCKIPSTHLAPLKKTRLPVGGHFCFNDF